ncbi:MAG: energy transducer TonB, partial [Candidatus Cloacimonetes bacterium]|nr:energy transducer TonB [Candidatus Cloacimonadota bacterium]
TGVVILDIEVLIDGSIGAIEVFQSLMPGPGGLDEAAILAVRKWQYQPAESGGNPVACWVKQPINFTLN